MAFGHHPYGNRAWSGRRYATQCMIWSIVAVGLYALGVSGAATKEGAPPLKPYGTSAEIQQCVADIRTSLHGRSVLGSRDTAAYIQDRGYLEDHLGIQQYDVMVDRCRTRFFHRYNRFYGRNVQ
jgi:hypothetical protein